MFKLVHDIDKTQRTISDMDFVNQCSILKVLGVIVNVMAVILGWSILDNLLLGKS